MQGEFNSTSFLFEWVPVLSALIPILALPWAAAKIFSYFRPHLIVVYKPNWLDAANSALEWNVEIINRTRKNRDIKITFVPVDLNSKVSLFWIDKINQRFFDLENFIENDKGVLAIKFWPERQNLFVNIKLDTISYPEAFCDDYEIQSQFMDVQDQKLLFYYPLIFVARLRVLWLASGFAMIALISIVRLVSLGYL